jgi:hypothetical protein
MSDATADRSEYGDINPWLIAILVAIATFMEVLDTTIANVALRYISGGLAVSSDEASWVVTTYLVANSVVLAASGWIAEMFGRKHFFLVCIGLFSISSLLYHRQLRHGRSAAHDSRRRFLVFCLVAHLSRHRIAVDLHSNNDSLI